MAAVVLSIHLVICIALIGLVLLQRSEGGALGIGGSGGSLMSGRGAGDALARMTQIAGGFFLVTSMSLTLISGAARSTEGRSVFDLLPNFEQSAPATPTPVEPAAPIDDPTQSSAPAQSELAAATPGEAIAQPAISLSPPDAAARERAGPLGAGSAQPVTATPTSATRAPPPAPTPNRAAATPASSPGQQQAAAPPPRTQPASQPVATQPAAQPPRQLVIPNTSGAATGEPTAAPGAESGDPDAVVAVRRQRAGPDQ